MKKNYNQPQTEFVRDFCTGAICGTPLAPEVVGSTPTGGWSAPIRKF